MKTNDRKRRPPGPAASCEEQVRGLPADQIDEDYTTIDCLVYYVIEHLEDGASDDLAARRRYGRLVGLLADYTESAYARFRSR